MPSIDHAHDTVVDAAIHVLLVDDNERWASFMAQKLEQYDTDLAVTAVLSPNEAIQQLRADTDVDCVMTDYNMPGINGLQLVEQIREIDPELPVILSTSNRDEELLADAIDAGLSDVCFKDPSTDQTEQFANRIVSAVRQYRLEQSIEEVTERYETVTQQSGDAIAIIQNETFVFWNQQLSDLTGYDNSEINTFYPAIDLFHPADRGFLKGKIDEWYAGNGRRQSHDVRLVTEQGVTRNCVIRGQRITYESEPAVLVSARDATAEKRRKRELKWEKQLNQAVQHALIDAETRDEIEDTICDQLVRYGYELAWTGQVINDVVHPQVVEGADTTGVADQTFAIEDGHDAAPNVWAARLKESQFLNDLTSLFETDWQQAALEAGYRSGAALPLVYEDALYGVLVVYNDVPDHFDETERTLLQSLANMMAFAIHNIETRNALSSRRTLDIEVQVRDTDYYLNELVQSAECRAEDAEFTVTGTVPHSNHVVSQYVTLTGIDIEQFRALALDHPSVTDVTVVADEPDLSRVQVLVSETTPESKLAALGAMINETSIKVDGASVNVELPAMRDAKEAIERLKEVYDGVTMESVVESERADSVLSTAAPGERAGLTDKQANALQVAFHHGYFERPRKNTAKEIAATLDVTHSTFLQHLRVAQQKLLTELYQQ